MPTFNAYPNADGYWASNGTFNTTGQAWVAGYSSVAYGAFFRFTNVTIASGSTVSAATMNFTTTVGAGTPDIRMAMEAADDPAFPTTQSDAAGRTITTSYGTYNTAWPGAGARTTPDFAASVQNVIDRGGWASGQAMQHHWRDNKATGSNYIQGYTVERAGTTDDPYLSITYTEPASGQPTNKRFFGVPHAHGQARFAVGRAA